jgi:hypothetical protein
MIAIPVLADAPAVVAESLVDVSFGIELLSIFQDAGFGNNFEEFDLRFHSPTAHRLAASKTEPEISFGCMRVSSSDLRV